MEDIVAFANPEAPQTEAAEQARTALARARPDAVAAGAA
jgi:hypothetical protein